MRSVKNTSKLTSFIFAQIETPTYVKCDIFCVYYLKFLYRERTANPSNIFSEPASASEVCILPEVVAISAKPAIQYSLTISDIAQNIQ